MVNEHKASEQGTRVRFARKIPSLLLTASGTSRIVYTHSNWREVPGGNFIQMKISYAHVNQHLQLFFSNFTVCLMMPARLVTWRAFLKRPENFSGPKTFRGSFRVNFRVPESVSQRARKHPGFRVVFSGLQRELDSDLLRT